MIPSMRRIGRWLLSFLIVISLFLCALSVAAMVVSRSTSRVLTFALAGTYCEISVRDGEYSVFVVEHYTRTEAMRWAAGRVEDGAVPGRGLYIEGPFGPDEPFAWPSIQHLRVVLGEVYQSAVRPWPQGWPPEMRTGRYASVVKVRLPEYVPVISSAIWLVARVVRTLRARSRNCVGRCATCLYDLRGNASGVCPECGTAIHKAAKP